MKIFNWMKNKLNGKEETNHKPNQDSVSHRTCNEEFNDWPNTLLSIGTFGNNNPKDSEKYNIQENLPSTQDHPENTTPEDFVEVDKELRLLLNDHNFLDSCFSEKSEKHNVIVEKFLDYFSEEGMGTNGSINCVSGKNISSDKKRNGIGKKSFSFLLKNALLCRGGFGPKPALRDTFSKAKLDNTRMEKILMAILRKKVHPQRKATIQKHLDNRERCGTDDEEHQEAIYGSKWVKTDSEYIVLEI